MAVPFKDVLDIMLCAAFLIFGVGMWNDWYRYGANIRAAGGTGTLRLYLWYGAFMVLDGLNHLFHGDWPLAIAAATVAWLTLAMALHAKHRGHVTWKRKELDPAFKVFQSSVEATAYGARAVAKEVRKLNKGGTRGHRSE